MYNLCATTATDGHSVKLVERKKSERIRMAGVVVCDVILAMELWCECGVYRIECTGSVPCNV